MQNKVSIIIPVYNVEPYLRRCLDSVIHQTLSDIEIICVNDSSPDNCLAILWEYVETDPRVKVIDFAENKGVSVARNAGLEVATGEYFGFVDPDDCVDLDFYEQLYNAAISENADIVKGERREITLDGKVLLRNLNKAIEENSKMTFTYEWQTAIYKSSLIYNNHINFPAECHSGEDLVFLNKCLIKAKKVVIVDEAYYCYHRREGSLNSKKTSTHIIESALYAKKLIFDELNKASSEEIDQKSFLYAYFTTLMAIVTHTSFRNDSPECKRLCAQSFVENYHKCKNKESIDEKISASILGYMLPFMKNYNTERIASELNRYSSADHLRREQLRTSQENLLKNLRNHMKKELKPSA